MGKVVISAVLGIAAAGAVMAAPYAGVQISPIMMMMLAAALSVGAAVAVMTRMVADKAGMSKKDILLSSQLKEAGQLIARFPQGGDMLSLSIKPDTLIDKLEVVDQPGKCITRDILVTLRNSGSTKFNPVELKRLFVALKDQPGFIHLILLDSHGEFVGYIPGFYAKQEFTGTNAEAQIAKYVDNVFSDDNNSVNLRQIEGAGKPDVISDEDKISDAIVKMAGGFRRLVVLRRGYHRRPIGLVNFSDLMSETLSEQTKPSLRSMLGR
ncbi:MAG: hypothetical protein ABSC92_10040 [Rhizomicrobium sp.]|jgi:hypothetical protein